MSLVLHVDSESERGKLRERVGKIRKADSVSTVNLHTKGQGQTLGKLQPLKYL